MTTHRGCNRIAALALLAMMSLGMAKLAPHQIKGGTGPRYFLVLLKHEAEVYKRSYQMYPTSLDNLEEDMKRRYCPINFFFKTKGTFHAYKITESSPNFFRARSYNGRGYPDYEITSSDPYPFLITENPEETNQ